MSIRIALALLSTYSMINDQYTQQYTNKILTV